MRRINSSNVVADLFGPGKDGFGKGNPAVGQLATYVSPEWCNHIQEEIARVIEGAGIGLDVTKYDQLSTAILAMITANLKSGTMPVVQKSANYTATVGDVTKVIEATAGNWTLAFAPAADLGDGWWCAVRNASTIAITLDPAEADLIDGQNALVIAGGSSCFIVCDGTRFRTIGLGGTGRAPGEIFWTRANMPPAGSLKANGAAVLRDAYRALDAAIYVGDAANATADGGYRCSDNLNPATSRSVTGAYIVLPNLMDRLPIGAGGLYPLGTVGGEASHTLTVAEMPAHNHQWLGGGNGGGNLDTTTNGGGSEYTFTSTGGIVGIPGDQTNSATYYTGPANTLGVAAAHNNLPPFLALLPCIQY